ncbi:TetR family transcriptional regulator [Corynebacterium aquilae]|uniref:TetR family transcriptional regulator n=1 Tax=Corynebacterium aquilae TaxID=203263 RepID=UPI0009530EE8|nr:TetR family transcriptional regulator [Corynebacterium aquilae]
MKEENVSLRETKRRATRAAIEDHATRLVLERGFDAVTVDDICQAAGVSKRTFFNYMESKDTAVIGPAPTPLTQEEMERFAADEHVPLLPALIDMALKNISNNSGTDGKILRRRKAIRQNHPRLVFDRMASFNEAHDSYAQAIASYLNSHPHQRQMPDEDVFAEARSWLMATTSCLQLGMHHWLASDNESFEALTDYCHRAHTHLEAITSAHHKPQAEP